jgi:hypothetical protein
MMFSGADVVMKRQCIKPKSFAVNKKAFNPASMGAISPVLKVPFGFHDARKVAAYLRAMRLQDRWSDS